MIDVKVASERIFSLQCHNDKYPLITGGQPTESHSVQVTNCRDSQTPGAGEGREGREAPAQLSGHASLSYT